MTKIVSVFRFEYDKRDVKTGEIISFIAYIAGYSNKDAQKYLNTVIGNDINIKAIGAECRLDAISDDVRNAIVASATKKKKPGRPPKKKKKK